MQPTSRSFQSLGPEGFHKVAYWEWGAEDAPRTALMVHGLTRNGRDFDDLAKAMASKGWRVAAVDVVGRGDSEWLVAKEGYDFATYVADMIQLIARLGANKVDWIGTSMGGVMGQMAAAAPGAPIKKLVLNDIGPFLDKAGLARIKGYVGQDPSFATYEEAEAAVNAVTGAFGPMDTAQRKRFCEVSLRERSDGTVTLNYDPKIAWQFHENEPEDVDMRPLWNLITIPTLVMRGAVSDLLSSETTAYMQANGPKAELYEVPDVGHAPALMSDAEINHIISFLEA